MMTRAQVEQVLKATLEIEGVATTTPQRAEYRVGKQYLSIQEFRQLCDDLCALLAPVSQPSRETLRELLHIYRYQSHDMHDGLPCPTCETFAEKLMAWATPHPLRREDLDALWEKHSCQEIATGEWRQIIKDAIWRWVCGEREHPHDAWCPHITWDRGEQRWVLNDKPDESYLIVQENWTVCPVCGKERPAPRPATPREA